MQHTHHNILSIKPWDNRDTKRYYFIIKNKFIPPILRHNFIYPMASSSRYHSCISDRNRARCARSHPRCKTSESG